jgi:hypothetical protein
MFRSILLGDLTGNTTNASNINQSNVVIYIGSVSWLVHETYLMTLPEDGPRHGPKHVAAIK